MCPIKLCIILVKQPACAHFGDDWKSGLIARRLSFFVESNRSRGFVCVVRMRTLGSTPRACPRALARCVRDHSSLSRGHRRRGREPFVPSRSRRVVILSFLSFPTLIQLVPTQTRRARLPVCARKPLGGQVLFTARTLSRPIVVRCRRRRGARNVARRARSRTTNRASSKLFTNVSAVASRARSSRASSKSPNARVASTGIRGGLDRSTRRRSVVTRLVSFSFSRARPHRHLFPRRSRARVQRSL